jgi:tight adherence protein C
MLEIAIVLSTFGFIVLIIYSAYALLAPGQSAVSERLQKLTPAAGGSARSTAPVKRKGLIERVADPLEKIAPPSPAEARKIKRLLMTAGYRGVNASTIYRGLQLSTLFGFPLLILGWTLFYPRPLDKVIIWTLLAFVAGFILPRFVLGRLIKRRQLKIRWALPDALDLMVVSIEAGMGLNAAMNHVGSELKAVHPDLCDEFELANLEIRVGREREEALRNMSERTGVDDLRSFVAMLIQADRFGTSIAQAVRVYADSLRVKRRQRAEQAAQKAAVKLLFPLACFLFPTLFIVALGPAILSLMDTFAKTN